MERRVGFGRRKRRWVWLGWNETTGDGGGSGGGSAVVGAAAGDPADTMEALDAGVSSLVCSNSS